MFNIREIKNEADIAEAQACVPEGCAEPPNWNTCVLLERDDKVIGVLGIQRPWKAEPFYLKEPDLFATGLAMGFFEGVFRTLQAKEFEFFIQDSNAAFQKFVEKRCDVEREAPGTVYLRRLE